MIDKETQKQQAELEEHLLFLAYLHFLRNQEKRDKEEAAKHD